MKFLIDFTSSGNKITNIYLEIKDAKEEFLSVLRSEKGSFFGIDYYFDLDNFSEKEKNIIYYLFYNKNFSFKYQNSELFIPVPVDYYFFTEIFNFKVFLKKDNQPVYFKKEDFIPEFVLNQDYEAITIKNIEKIKLIQTNSRYLVLIDRTIRPLKAILKEEAIIEIFEDGLFYLENDLKNELLLNVNRNKKFFRLPKIIEVNEAEIVFHININNDYFELSPYLDFFGEKVKINFEEIRQRIIFNEDIFLKEKEDNLLLLKSTTQIYSKIRKVNEVLRKNFFGLLNEIKGTKIISKDKKTLFSKILFELSEDIKIEINGIKEISPIKNEAIEIDWLETDFAISLGGYELSEEEIGQLLENGYIRKDEKFITISDEELKKKEEILRKIFFLKKQNHAGKKMLPFLANLKNEVTIKLPDKYKELIQTLENIKKNRFNPEEINLSNLPFLRDYQKVGVYWINFLYKYDFGGILADEMGLGKSLQTLAFLFFLGNKVKTSLIVCPYALMENWANEINKFFKNKFKFALTKGNRKEREKLLAEFYNYDIIITSYSLLIQDENLYENRKIAICILDEAQHIKNKDSKRTKAVKNLNAVFKIALTGTPIENYPIELWSIFDFLMPDYLGNHKWFKKNIETPILKKQDNETMELFKKLISPYILRRTKDKVLKELPPKIEQEIEIELTEKQKIIYLEVLNKFKESILYKIKQKGLANSYIDFLSLLTRLRQLSIHPGLIDSKFFEEEDISSKTNVLMELILESIDSNHKVVIYSQFVQMLKFVEKRLKKEDVETLYLDGKTKNRFELVEYFNTSSEKILLASIKAGGVGLNITGADSVILLDPWWNPTVEEQAIDRLHRLGQKRVVFVYKIITKGTIEEKMKILKQKKKKISKELTEFQDNILKTLSIKEIEELLSF
ncbi:MAG: DEAD/DEAH box helicase [Brevinematales bacterium]|nr:DEAD/DEAH box helicase [Brevinematales bacterium]